MRDKLWRAVYDRFLNRRQTLKKESKCGEISRVCKDAGSYRTAKPAPSR